MFFPLSSLFGIFMPRVGGMNARFLVRTVVSVLFPLSWPLGLLGVILGSLSPSISFRSPTRTLVRTLVPILFPLSWPFGLLGVILGSVSIFSISDPLNFCVFLLVFVVLLERALPFER